MTVQDDERERELVRMFNLRWDPSHQRAGVDAVLDVDVDGRSCRFEVEVKSTTGATVSTARDVGMEHIGKWRRKLFVIGFYARQARRPELKHCLCLTPLDMEPWIRSIEDKIGIDFQIAARASRRLELEDLYEVCGHRQSWSIADAKRLHKQQWTAQQYAAAADLKLDSQPQISPAAMLEILRLRARYIAERGATLNNPHIPKGLLQSFLGTDRLLREADWAAGVRRIAANFVRAHPDHPAIQPAGLGTASA